MKVLYVWIAGTLLLAVLLIVLLGRTGNSNVYYYALGVLVVGVLAGVLIGRWPR